MSFAVARPNVVDFRVNQLPERPSIGGAFGEGLGAGLGQGVNDLLNNHIRKSVVDRALQGMKPGSSVDELLRNYASADPRSQEALRPLIEHQIGQQQAKGKQEFEFEKQRRALENKKEIEQLKAQQKPLKGAQGVLEKRKAETIANIIDDVPKLEEAKASIERMDELRKELSGLKGYAKAAFGSQDAAEFNALGLASIEPILKIFNPRGALPQAKIEMIRDLYAPTASDTQRTIQGKLNALRKFADAGEKRAEKLSRLMEIHGDDIPLNEFLKFEKESAAVLDNLNKKNASNLGDLPKGFKRMIHKETGEILDVPLKDVNSAKQDGFE